jgi:predicted nucleotidyltransferase
VRADGLEERREVSGDERDRLLRAARRVLGPRPDVVAAYLHGSAARGEPARDLDIALAFRAREPGFADG